MKLWIRQTLICLMVILLSFSACLYLFVAQQTQQQLDMATESGIENVEVFCEYLSTLDRTTTIDYNADDVTRYALIQYTFSTYAHLLQNAERSYSLVADGEYLYNISAWQPMQLLPMADPVISAHCMTVADELPLLVAAQTVRILNTPVTVYVAQDISTTFDQIAALTRNAQFALLACLLLSALLLPLTLRRTLRPLRTLTNASEKISGGQYALRTGIESQDEVGELSRSFDHMAETIEQKINDLQEQARRREMLLGALTHEMKTPMTSIIGFSDSLLSMPLTEEGRMEAAHEIHEAAQRTERLSQKMMQLISMTDCPVLLKKPLDTKELLETVHSAITTALDEKCMTLKMHCETEGITGDGDLIFSLLTNLIDNAIKASPAGQSICLTAKETAGHYELTVADHGSGIPREKIALVTEPFYRVDKARSRKMGGAGLGLSLCRMIAQAHGGELHIESQVGKGTAITMRWPKEDDHE